MDKLPQEILIWIVSYLSTNDKLKCILVCRKWHDWISSNNLYQELTFVNNCGKSAKALELFEKRPEIAFNISKLRLEKCKLKPSFALKLPSLFPRLKQLIWYDNSEAIQHEEESKNWKFFQQQQQQKYEEALERWSKTLEEMKWDFMSKQTGIQKLGQAEYQFLFLQAHLILYVDGQSFKYPSTPVFAFGSC